VLITRRSKLYYTASGIITQTIEWSKIPKIQFYKYGHIAIKFMFEFFGCDYCLYSIFIELYFSNFRPLTSFSVMIPYAV